MDSFLRMRICNLAFNVVRSPWERNAFHLESPSICLATNAMRSSDQWSFWLLGLDLPLDVGLADLGLIGPCGVISVLGFVALGLSGHLRSTV